MKQTAVELLIEQIKSKADSLSTSKKENRIVKGIYVDCLCMAREVKEIEKQQQGFNEEEVKNIMAETWIKCVGNDGNDFKETRDKILEKFKNK